MALSQCLCLSKTRDYIHIHEEVIFFSEIDKALHIFAFFPSKGYGYSGSFSSLFLRELARKFNFPNMHLLLTWVKDRISEEKFAFQDVNPESVDFIIGSALPVQIVFQLSRSQNEVDLVLSISKALLHKQAYIEELEKANAESLNHLKCVGFFALMNFSFLFEWMDRFVKGSLRSQIVNRFRLSQKFVVNCITYMWKCFYFLQWFYGHSHALWTLVVFFQFDIPRVLDPLTVCGLQLPCSDFSTFLFL